MLVVGVFALGIGNSSLACDETFHGTLRHGVGYLFDDTFHGTKSTSYYLWNWNVSYNEQYDYNNSSSFPQFSWTPAIKAQGYEVRPNQSIKILETKTPYNIYSVPAKRAYNNLLVKYTITYSDNAAGNNKRNHVECKYYEISWCGDGVLDRDYGEQCDPKDPNKTGWGNGGCDNSCKPITIVVPPKIP